MTTKWCPLVNQYRKFSKEIQFMNTDPNTDPNTDTILTKEDLDWCVANLETIRQVRRFSHEIVRINPAVNLSDKLRAPFPRANLLAHNGEGISSIKRRGDDLYINGSNKVSIRPSEKIGGVNLDKEEFLKMEEDLSLHFLYHLKKHPSLWPEAWKMDGDGNPMYIFFLNGIFHDPVEDCIYASCGYWSDGMEGVVVDWCDIRSCTGERCYAATIA